MGAAVLWAQSSADFGLSKRRALQLGGLNRRKRQDLSKRCGVSVCFGRRKRSVSFGKRGPAPTRVSPQENDGESGRVRGAQEASSSSSSTAASGVVAELDARGQAFRLLAVFAGAGAVETAYLTLSKVFSSSVFCPSSGCETILTSRYAEILGLPTSLFGFATYSAVSYLSWLAATEKGKGYRLGVLGGSTVLGSVSAFLGYVLATQFPDETCLWCLSSCFFSAACFVLALWASSEDGDPVKTTIPPVVISPLIVSSLVFAFGLGPLDPSTAEDLTEIPFREPVVNTESSQEALDLVKKLNEAGAKMYGAFWCSHCFEQKQVFGKEAMKDFPYVECFPAGYKKGMEQEKVCESADVRGYPTWVINGERIEGDQTLEELEAKL